jgi:hypothetical protein
MNHRKHVKDECYLIELRFRGKKLRGVPMVRKRIECETCGEVIYDKVIP